MLCRSRKTFLCVLHFYLTVFSVISENAAEYRGASNKLNKRILFDMTSKLLTKLECETTLSKDVAFAALLSEFLIKQQVRFYESTRYEEQVYFHILHKLNSLLRKGASTNYETSIRRILGNVFQKNVLLQPNTLRKRQIDTHLEYKSLSDNYKQLQQTGFPNATLSDQCLDAIASLEQCDKLRADCLDVISSDLPTYGYQRMHQVLLMYVFAHHNCARHFGSKAVYDIMASERCSQVYREQQALHELVPTRPQYKDLYLEQIVLCGLFGYVEFLNWHNLEMLLDWPNVDGCHCMPVQLTQQMDCSCSNHLNSLTLVYYVTGLLLLE